jgi:O-antigen/teichoic acid export membrane protein
VQLRPGFAGFPLSLFRYCNPDGGFPPLFESTAGPPNDAKVNDMAKQTPAPRAALGVLLLSGSNAFRLTVQFLLFPVLARLLTPADYGLIGLAMPVVLFALTLGEGGMGPALLRAADPHGEVEATMFWTALATGILCAALVLLTAPLIAATLANAKITPVLMWLAPVMILSSLSSVPSVRIQKRGATWIFAVGDVASSITGAATALSCALGGWGVWSLVSQQLVVWSIKLAVVLGLAGSRIPGRPNPAAFRYLLRHGTPLVGSNLLNLFSISVDALLIGRILGVEQLGFYVLAFQIVRIPEAVLNGPVFVSFLPAVVRLDMDRQATETLFISAMRIMLSISAPLMLGLTLTADLSVPLLLGSRWHQSIPLLMFLAPPAIAQTLGWLSGALLVGRGRSGLQFRLALLNAALTLAGVLGGAFFGIIGIAAGVGFAVVVGNFAYLAAAMVEVRVSVRTLAMALAPILSALAIMGFGVAALRYLLPADLAALPTMLLAAGLGILLYAGGIWILAPEIMGFGAALFWRRTRAIVE